MNRSNSGITVSDATLGQVKMSWNDFDRVVFHGTDDEASVSMFDGGRRIEGTVVTRDGDSFTGQITWGGDEAYTWEMLNGSIRGVEFHFEFSQIETIEAGRRGLSVTLTDGRTFDLTGGNDMHPRRGVTIETRDGRSVVPWSDFAELRLSN